MASSHSEMVSALWWPRILARTSSRSCGWSSAERTCSLHDLRRRSSSRSVRSCPFGCGVSVSYTQSSTCAVLQFPQGCCPSHLPCLLRHSAHALGIATSNLCYRCSVLSVPIRVGKDCGRTRTCRRKATKAQRFDDMTKRGSSLRRHGRRLEAGLAKGQENRVKLRNNWQLEQIRSHDVQDT